MSILSAQTMVINTRSLKFESTFIDTIYFNFGVSTNVFHTNIIYNRSNVYGTPITYAGIFPQSTARIFGREGGAVSELPSDEHQILQDHTVIFFKQT